MRLVGVLLMGLGAMIAWFLGVKGEDLATLRGQIFAFFQVPDPGPVLPVPGSVPAAAAASAGARRQLS